MERFLEGQTPAARDLFWRFAELVQSCGAVTLAPAKTRVGFQARMIFAAVNHLATGRLDAHFVLYRKLEHARVRRVESLSVRCHVHHIRVTGLEELNEELLEFLREAYETGEQR